MILGLAWYYNVLATLFGFLAIFLMMVILLQRGKGVGLAGAFGGAGGQTAFGSKTGDVLTWATVVIAFLFLVFAVGLNYLFAPISGGLGGPAPVVAPATTPPVTQTPAPATPAQPAPF
ncbi:MAG: preprotein translocase subunit SecG, partial [Planctomycetota bacterium]